MKVLFISSGNSNLGISPIILNQGESLQNAGIEIEYFTIVGKGLFGYIKNIPKLRRFIKVNKYDAFHAHYSLSAIIASLAGAKPLVVSLMGSDVNASKKTKILLGLFNHFFWKTCIVKTKGMADKLGFTAVEIVPNGVDLSEFFPFESTKAKKLLKWNENHIHILFAANPNRYEKNYSLAEKSFKKLNIDNADLHTFSEIPHHEIKLWLNAADVIILSSLWEGSPNVVKEAMACNKIILTTNVGDVSWLFGTEQGFYISSHSVEDYSEKLSEAIKYFYSFKSSNGRNRLLELQLDSKTIAERLTQIYRNSLIK